MPNINPQHKRLPLHSTLNITQQTHSNNIVQPVIVLVASLKHNSQLQTTARLRRPRRLQQDIRTIMRAEIVSSVSAEDSTLWICDAPICSKVKDGSCWRSISWYASSRER